MDEKETVISNGHPNVSADSLPTKGFTVFVHINDKGGIDIEASHGSDFYAVLGAVEGARALLRCCVIDGYNKLRKAPSLEED